VPVFGEAVVRRRNLLEVSKYEWCLGSFFVWPYVRWFLVVGKIGMRLIMPLAGENDTRAYVGNNGDGSDSENI
jgi:hypothetical protein